MRHSPRNRRMNSENGKRSLCPPSHGKQMDVAKAKAKEERGRVPTVSKRTTSKAEKLQHFQEKRGSRRSESSQGSHHVPLQR
eukprot:6652540-Ditylum_brightwellii.AAC.1